MERKKLIIRLSTANDQIHDHKLTVAKGEVTQLYLQDGRLEVRGESTCADSASDIIARIQSFSPEQLFFESRVEGCSVHSPPVDYRKNLLTKFGTLTLPFDEEEQQLLLCPLRPGDIVKFQRHHFQFQLLLLPEMAPKVKLSASQATGGSTRKVETAAPTVPAMAGSEEIHVRSSVKSTESVRVGSDEETDDELDITNADSMDIDDTELTVPPASATKTVAETPNMKNALQEADLPSTAPRDEPESADSSPESSALPGPDSNSPLAKKSAESQGDSQARNAAVTLQRSESLGAKDEDQDKAMFPLARKTPEKTYAGHMKRRGQASSSSRGGETPESAARSAAEAQAEDDIEETIQHLDDEVLASDPLTSEAPNVHKIAVETATRSMAGTKRKSVDSEDEDAAQPSPKRARLPKAAQLDEDTVKRPRQKASASPAKPQRSTKRTDTVGTGHDIVVASRPPPIPATRKTPRTKAAATSASPKVVIPSDAPRATPASSTGSAQALEGKLSKVLISSSTLKYNPKVKTFLREAKAAVVYEMPTKKSAFLCVVPEGKLKTTAKTLRSLALGKLVVTEDWVIDSQRAGHLLDPPDYVHPELEDSIEVDRSMLFFGKTLFFTSALAKLYGDGWNDITALGNEAGASRVMKGTIDRAIEIVDTDNLIIFGTQRSDPDAKDLVTEHGRTVYDKGMLTQSVLRSEVDLESEEFVLRFEEKGAGAGGKRKKR